MSLRGARIVRIMRCVRLLIRLRWCVRMCGGVLILGSRRLILCLGSVGVSSGLLWGGWIMLLGIGTWCVCVLRWRVIEGAEGFQALVKSLNIKGLHPQGTSPGGAHPPQHTPPVNAKLIASPPQPITPPTTKRPSSFVPHEPPAAMASWWWTTRPKNVLNLQPNCAPTTWT